LQHFQLQLIKLCQIRLFDALCFAYTIGSLLDKKHATGSNAAFCCQLADVAVDLRIVVAFSRKWVKVNRDLHNYANEMSGRRRLKLAAS